MTVAGVDVPVDLLPRRLCEGVEPAQLLTDRHDEAVGERRQREDTENAEKEKKYLHLETVIGPLAKPRWQILKKLYLDHPKRKSLPKNVYGVMDRFIANEFELYREENIALEATDAELRQ